MPIYEYQCEQCGHRMEALQKISADPLKECPQCEQQSLKKLVSAASFRLKGGGWYETDFKTGDKKQLAESDSSGREAKESKSDGEAKSNTEKGGADSKSVANSGKKEAKSETKQAKNDSSKPGQKKAS